MRSIRSAMPGLSPRVRGNRRRPLVFLPWPGSIPACAGEPTPATGILAVAGVYPRVCGGTEIVGITRFGTAGLSPRVRGNPDREPADPCARRSIPACAGEPCRGYPMPAIRRVYPRVCGGTFFVEWGPKCRAGLSPRVRGNQAQGSDDNFEARSIPACAGEPGRQRRRRPRKRVYPRVCGGTPGQRSPKCQSTGLSPRVRGNPRAAQPKMPVNRVYPRVCGGTQRLMFLATMGFGLSPRVRGNRRSHQPALCKYGSIPACAGEPWTWNAKHRRLTVYPRVCGGTSVPAFQGEWASGLSPRVRGNRV